MKKVLLLLVLVVCCSASFSQTGVLDQTFGVGGKVVTLPAHYSDGSRAVALQSSGKIIVVGNSGIFSGNGFAVRRFNANGSIDSTFGVNGIAGKAINVNDGASCIAIQSDDKILLGGSTNSYMSGETYFVIIRFKADGIIDSSFGYNGISTANFSYTTENRDNLVDLFIRPNGKILACGSSGDGFSGTGGFALTQLNPDGLVDTTFGQRGQVLIDTFQFGNISSILQPDGKIVSGGYRSKRFSSVSSFALLRFTANGHIDSTFGNNGFSLDTLAGFSVTDAILQPDGKIVFAGNYQNYSGITLARFQSSGLLDVTFGSGGIAKSIIRDSSFYGVGASQLLLDLSGKILIAGTIRQDFLLARTNNDGTRDYNFGKRGIIATDINGYNDWASGAVIQQDGKVIVAGSSGNGTNTSSFSLVRYESNALVKYNTIVGNAFLDNNSNGIKDSGEHLFPYADFMVASSHPDTTILNGAFGKFMLDVDTGNYATTVLPYLPYYNTAPLSYNSLFGSYFNTDSFSFAMQPIPGKRDLMIQLFALNNARPGFPLLYKIVYKNEGTDTVNGTIVFIKNPKVQYDSASTTANSVIADTTKWNFINLKPLQTKSIIAYLKVLTPPAVTVGDTLLLSVKIESTGNELTPTNNLSTLRQVVKNSFDPNDKTENHGGRITNVQVSNGDYMQYTIRFQNTGNDTAFNVYLKDTLDSKLNWSTLQIITASHSYQMTMADGKCQFKFPGINLVDSNHNEPGSHGYIVYRIKPLSNVQIGDVIKNTAAIYFDYNLPVYTNTEMTTVVAETFPLKLLTFTVRKQGKSNLLNWTTANETNVDHFEIERSASNREFIKIGTVKAGAKNYSYTDINPFASPLSNSVGEGPGVRYYRLRMVDKDGQFTYSPIRMINNSGTFSINIYPNPAKDYLQIQIDSDRKTPLQLLVLSMDGKVILSNSVDANEGSILRSINISALAKGSYFLKATDTDKDEQVVKFEKQ